MDRAEKRRQLKTDSKAVEYGLALPMRDAGQLIALMRVLHEQVKLSIRAESVAPLMAFLHANLAATSRSLAQIPIACGKGCTHCCHLWVAASPPEVIHAAKSIPEARRPLLRQALTASRSTPAPCVLLDDGLCGIYEARPLVCRTATSVNAEACRKSYVESSGEAVSMPIVYMAARNGYGLAFFGALKHAGLAYRSYELSASLARVMDAADAERRWLTGEDILSGLPQDAGSDLFAHENASRLYAAAFGNT